MLKIYESDIKQLCVGRVKLGHKDKSAKCRFFVLPEDGPALLGVPNIEMLSILRITCDVIGESHEGRKLESQTVEASNRPTYRTNEAPLNETDIVGMHDGKIYTSDCFRSSINKVADKKV